VTASWHHTPKGFLTTDEFQGQVVAVVLSAGVGLPMHYSEGVIGSDAILLQSFPATCTGWL